MLKKKKVKVKKLTATGMLEHLKTMIELSEEDANKFDAGTKAPATRIRKALSEVQKKCKEYRIAIMDLKKEM